MSFIRRGCARELDENGATKPMRLYFSTSQPMLILEHWGRMFPRAPSPKTLVVEEDDVNTQTENPRRKSIVRQQRLLAILIEFQLPNA
jgi:hypothetical protein